MLNAHVVVVKNINVVVNNRSYMANKTIEAGIFDLFTPEKVYPTFSKEPIVVGAFDGISCGQQAFEDIGIIPKKYYASEIEKGPILITQQSYPNTIQLGSVTHVTKDMIKEEVDILIGGSPCFVEITRIITKEGLKYIEDIKVGDYVLTHKNRFRKVLKIGNTIKDTVSVHAHGYYAECTKEHPYYVRTRTNASLYNNTSVPKLTEPEWIPVERLTADSFVGIPTKYSELHPQYTVLEDNILEDGFLTWYRCTNVNPSRKQQKVYNLEVEEDNSYTADGAVVHNCQSFSFAGKQAGMSTVDEQEVLSLEHYLQLKEKNYEFEGQSYLFWEYVRLLKELKPKYFLLENVRMDKKWEAIITNALGVEPVMINSALVSAQNRKRLYWTDIPFVKQPEDQGILLKHIVHENTWTDRDKSLAVTSRVHGGATPERYLNKSMHQMVFNINPSGKGMNGQVTPVTTDKASCVTTNKGEGSKVAVPEGTHVILDEHGKPLSEKEIAYMLEGNEKWTGAGACRLDRYTQYKDNKSNTVTANCYKGVPYNCLFEELNEYIVPFDKTLKILDKEVEKGKVGFFKKDSQANRVYYIHDKAVTLCGEAGGGAAKMGQYLFGQAEIVEKPIRQIVPLEEHESKDNLVCLAGIDVDGKRRVGESKAIQRKFSQGNRVYSKEGKAPTLTASNKGGTAGQSEMIFHEKSEILGIVNKPRGNNPGGLRNDGTKSPTISANSWQENNHLVVGQSTEGNEVKDISEPLGCISPDRVEKRQNGQRFSSGKKFYTLTAQDKHGILIEGYIRKLTPQECERLQTVKDNYTLVLDKNGKQLVSQSARYKALGNGWTVKVIAHIFKHLLPYMEK